MSSLDHTTLVFIPHRGSCGVASSCFLTLLKGGGVIKVPCFCWKGEGLLFPVLHSSLVSINWPVGFPRSEGTAGSVNRRGASEICVASGPWVRLAPAGHQRLITTMSLPRSSSFCFLNVSCDWPFLPALLAWQRRGVTLRLPVNPPLSRIWILTEIIWKSNFSVIFFKLLYWILLLRNFHSMLMGSQNWHSTEHKSSWQPDFVAPAQASSLQGRIAGASCVVLIGRIGHICRAEL